ncbi:MAG: hypothetical protein BJ554DRAFT_2035 [Olpidium bornovanus]|uniref:tRNA uridine(34) hydroxylase N-terminal domain-containing protein n=1 Tax=Olpidium bornovanus TaxID=278681 RepID=A0A8H8A0U5_9FUNG|nr:MAG: hypothetical protein BJ554DRAFT_2035 [Olpidium bornovanus]
MLARPVLRRAQQRCVLPAAALCPPPRQARPCPPPSAPFAVRSEWPSECSCRRLSTSVALDVARPLLDCARPSFTTGALRPVVSCADAIGPIRCAAPFHSSAAPSAHLKFQKDPMLYYRKIGILPEVRGSTTTWSFYWYTPLPADKLEDLRLSILRMFLHLSVRGRLHLAPDGISAHICCPDRNLGRVTKHLGLAFPDIPMNVLHCYEGQPDGGPKFTTLHVRAKKQILNDGLSEVDTSANTTPQAKHVSPEEWHAMVTSEIERAKQEGTEKPLIIEYARTLWAPRLRQPQGKLAPGCWVSLITNCRADLFTF